MIWILSEKVGIGPSDGYRGFVVRARSEPLARRAVAEFAGTDRWRKRRLTDCRIAEPDGDTAMLLWSGDDRGANAPAAMLAAGRLAPSVTSPLKHLNDRHQLVLLLRNGMVDGRRWSLVEIATQLGVTRGRVGQMEGFAWARVRREWGDNVPSSWRDALADWRRTQERRHESLRRRAVRGTWPTPSRNP